MSQVEGQIDLPTSPGYALKQASSALRTAMEAVLRPLGMSVTHYSCLELLSQRPGLSNSELARGAFVTRQSMNTLLLTLEQEGEVRRSESAIGGRALPTELTAEGRRRLTLASAAVKAVEDRMTSGLGGTERVQLVELLARCVVSLRADEPPVTE